MSGYRRPSSLIEEDIVVKPSTELIADEYEHFQDDASRKILVHTFSSKEKAEYADAFADTLATIGLIIDENKMHCLNTDNCLKILDNSTYINFLRNFFIFY